MSQIDVSPEQVSALAFTSRSELLIAGDQSLLIAWDCVEDRERSRRELGQMEVCAIIPLPRSKQVLTAAKASVKVRNEHTLAEEYALPPFSYLLRAAAVSPDERLLVATTVTGVVPVWDLAARAAKSALASDADLGNAVAFHPGGGYVRLLPSRWRAQVLGRAYIAQGR